MNMIQQKIYARARNDQDVIRKMMNAFRQFDVNSKGVIGQKDLQRIIKHFYDLDLGEEQIKAVFAIVDSDGNGYIDQQEFVHAFAHRLNQKTKNGAKHAPQRKDSHNPKRLIAQNEQQLWSDT